MSNREYLGDAVYAEFDGFSIILTTEDGLGVPENRIYLEPEVYQSLTRYAEKMNPSEK